METEKETERHFLRMLEITIDTILHTCNMVLETKNRKLLELNVELIKSLWEPELKDVKEKLAKFRE